MTIYENNFESITKIIDLAELKEKGHLKYVSSGLMPLFVDYLENYEGNIIRIAIAHNYIQNGDVMADPDMELRINFKNKTCEALSFHQDNINIYHRVYSDDGLSFSKSLKYQLNSFLSDWLTNLSEQNYTMVTEND